MSGTTTSCGRTEDQACTNTGCASSHASTESSGRSQQPKQRPLCVKCKEQPANLRLMREPMCRECFTGNLMRKMKTVVRRKLGVRKGDRLMVAVSGGPCSRALLELLHRCIVGDGRKKMFFEIGIVHIDESSLFPEFAESASSLAELEKLCKTQYPSVPYHCRSLDSVFATSQSQDSSCPDTVSQLKQLFKSVSNPSQREDLLLFLRNRLLSQLASELEYTSVCTAECADRMATRALASTSKARGYSLTLDVQHEDIVHEEKFFRPMRDVLASSVGHFVHIAKLQTVFFPSFSTGLTRKIGINKLAGNFIHHLQSLNPSTVPNILRTCDKLLLPTPSSNKISSTPKVGEKRKEVGKQVRINRFDQARQHLMSLDRCSLCGSARFLVRGGDLLLLAKKLNLHSVCVPCLQMLSENDLQTEQFPSYVRGSLVSRQEVRSQIADFILPDADLDPEDKMDTQ